MLTAAVHDIFTSHRVSYLSASLISLLALNSLVRSLRPKNAVLRGVRNSCEMYRTYDFLDRSNATWFTTVAVSNCQYVSIAT